MTSTQRTLQTLVVCAQDLALDAIHLHLPATVEQCSDIHDTLLGAMMCLRDDPEYLDAADAFATAAADLLADAAALIGQARARA